MQCLTVELELSKEVVVLGEETFTFVHWKLDRCLAIFCCCELTSLEAWDGSVARHNHGHDTTLSLNSETKRDDIKEKHLGGLCALLAGENGSLDGGTVCNSLVRVDLNTKMSAMSQPKRRGWSRQREKLSD